MELKYKASSASNLCPIFFVVCFVIKILSSFKHSSFKRGPSVLTLFQRCYNLIISGIRALAGRSHDSFRPDRQCLLTRIKTQ